MIKVIDQTHKINTLWEAQLIPVELKCLHRELESPVSEKNGEMGNLSVWSSLDEDSWWIDKQTHICGHTHTHTLYSRWTCELTVMTANSELIISEWQVSVFSQSWHTLSPKPFTKLRPGNHNISEEKGSINLIKWPRAKLRFGTPTKVYNPWEKLESCP